jgi:thiol-disulfide isomerase/thioredoxin
MVSAMRPIVLAIAVLSCTPTVAAQDATYADLVAAHARAVAANAGDPVAEFVPRFAAAAAAHRGKEEAVPFLVWIVRNACAGAPAGDALATLAESHGRSLQVGPALEVLPHLSTHFGDAAGTALIEQVIAIGSPPELQARALWARAAMAVTSQLAADDARLASAKADLDMARKLTKDPALAAAIAQTEACPRGLAVGDVLPDIAGFDLDGAPFRLCDYRGKVVVLVFWGDWCGPCRAMLPQTRTLASRLKDAPFALVGVNSDRDPGPVLPRLAAQQIGWRSFWNGPQGTKGPIAARFSVRAWPTIYILDGKAVVRFTNKRGEAMDEAVDQLLAETTAKAK